MRGSANYLRKLPVETRMNVSPNCRASRFRRFQVVKVQIVVDGRFKQILIRALWFHSPGGSYSKSEDVGEFVRASLMYGALASRLQTGSWDHTDRSGTTKGWR